MSESKSIGRYPHNRERDMQDIVLLPMFMIFAAIGYFAPRLLDFEMPYADLFYLMLAAMLVAGAWTTFTSGYRLWMKPEIELFEHGIRYTTRQDSQFWRWQDVDDVRLIIRKLLPAYYVLIVNGKRVVALNERFQRVHSLIQQIYNITRPSINVEDWVPEEEEIEDYEALIHDDDEFDESVANYTIEVSLIRRKSLYPVIIALIGLCVWGLATFSAIKNATSDGLINPGWLMSAAVAFIIPILAVRVLLREWRYFSENPRYAVEENGLHLTMRSGTTSWRWDEIDEVRVVRTFEWLRPVTPGFAIKVSGQPIAILNDRYRNRTPFEIFVGIKHEASVKPRYLESLERGDTLSFGEISLDQTGITHLRRTFVWSEMSSYDLPYISGERMFVLYNRDNRRLISTHVNGITHLSLLTEILHERLNLP